jgi:gamma-glutamyl-gamma-aminobutyrate hydrolase PuuD
MVKILGITQRIDEFNDYGEIRDSIDHRLYNFFSQIGYQSMPLSNMMRAKDILENLKINALVLSGGNDVNFQNKNRNQFSLIRDKFEKELLSICIKKKIPILGICRGMQLINVYFGGSIKKIKNHSNKINKIKFCDKLNFVKKGKNLLVPCYHNWGLEKNDVSKSLDILAESVDGKIECIRHKKYKIYGIMWHPERRSKKNSLEQKIIKNFLQ